MADSTNLSISVEVAKGLERRMTVRVPAEQIEREVDSRLDAVGRKAKLKGFRPGKAPKNVIRQRFGSSVRQEVLSDVIRSTYSQAVAQQDLKPAGGPSIQALPQSDGRHFAYMAVFEVYPEIKLASLEKLTIERPVVEISDADVTEMIEKLRLQRAEWQTVDRKSADGNRVVIDFSGTIDDKPFAGSEGKDVKIVVGEGQVIADFDEALKNLSAGESTLAKVTFPSDYHKESLAGKNAEFQITVQRVEEQVLPEIDDEFIESFGVEEGGVEGLNREVRSNMQRELDERIRTQTKARTLDALLAANEISVPRALISEEIGHLQAETMRRMGVTDRSQAPPPEQFVELATRRVALGLLVDRLINDNAIMLDRDRLDERIRELSAPYDNPDEAMRVYRTTPDLMAQVESSVLEDQVVEFVLEKAKTKAQKLGFKEFMNA